MRFSLSILFICIANSIFSQKPLPRYLDVATQFFKSYSHVRVEPNDRVFFSKKKEGWYADVVDLANDAVVKSSQLFWDIQKGQYVPLFGFGEGRLTDAEVDEKIETFLREDYSFKQYESVRCRYFGYNKWDIDMITDFGDKTLSNDTLIEGLARAYAAYAERYLWSGFGGAPSDDNDPLKSKLGTLEIPSKERVGKFIYYINKSIECYKQLESRNPGYKLKVGTPGIKIVNEQFHLYQQLMMCGYTAEANKIMNEIPSNDSIYLALGYAYLNGCPPNSILITDGDNDTYPLWLLQEKKGYRKDVLVLNTSLLGFAPYINMLKKKYPLLFSATASFYGKKESSYVLYEGARSVQAKPNSSLQQLVSDIVLNKNKSLNDGSTVYRVKDISFNVDLARFRKICDQQDLNSNMKIELKDYLFLSDVMILDIIKSNFYTRPICFGSKPLLIDKDYFLQEAFAYRIVPFRVGTGGILRKSEVSKIENYLKGNSKPVLVRFKNGDGSEYFENALYGKLSELYAALINYYLVQANGEKKANEYAAKFIDTWKISNLHCTVSDFSVAQALLRTSYKKEGVRMFGEIAQSLISDYESNDAFPIYYKKEDYLEWMNYMKNLLENYDASTEELDRLIKEFDQ